jgi:hypothetical protein
MSEVYSIRESLQGKLQTFIRGSGFSSIFLEDLIRDLVVLLSAYREEDVPMFPAVYIGSRREDFGPIFTTGTPVKIATIRQSSDAASALLKDCAPLAKEGWAVFAYLENGTVCYGVFRSARHSLSTGADEVIQDLGSQVQLMLLRNCGHQAVELHNTSKEHLTAVFKIAPALHLGLDSHVASFVEAATATLNDAFELRAYLKRAISAAIQHCHGTLLAAIPAFEGESPSSLLSGVQPDPYIDFATLHSEAVRLQDANSLADLRSAEVLMEGMIGSDGIVVFGCDGSVRAYRSFIKPEPSEAVQLSTEGGARRRTFELMKLRMPVHYKAALYRSQDGETKCEVR